MKYIVTEIQKFDNGAIAVVPPVVYDTREEADSKFYTILAAAALSGLPKHGVIITTENCKLIISKCYNREAPVDDSVIVDGV